MKKHKASSNSWVVLAVALITAATLVAPAALQAAPTAPSWLPGQPMLAGTQVIAMWLPVPGAVKYIIYLNGQKLMESPANQYIATAPDAGGEYKLEVTAVDAAGAESPRSAPGVFRIVVVEPPQNLNHRLDRVAKFILLRWDRSQGAVITNLYRSESPSGPFNMLASLTDDTYKDSEVEVGKTYYYALSSKDITGKESGRTEVYAVKVEGESVVVRVTGPPLRIVPTREKDYFQNWQGTEIGCVSSQFFQQSDVLYSPQGGFLRVLDQNLKVLRSLRIVPPEGFKAPYPPTFTRIFMTSDSDGVASDDSNSMVHFFDIRNDQVLLRSSQKLRMVDPRQRPDIFEKVPPGQRGIVPTPIAVAARSDGTAIAFDVKAGIACLVDEKDGVFDWIYEYKSTDGASKIFSAVVDALPVGGGDVLLFSPTNRKIVRLNIDDMQAKWEAGAGDYSGIVGKFVGMGGATLRDGAVIVSDPTLHTTQAFDVKTGTYLYAFGDPSGKPDEKNAQRAKTDYSFPNLPYVFPDGKTLYISLTLDKACSIRTVLDEDGALRAKFAEEAIGGGEETSQK